MRSPAVDALVLSSRLAVETGRALWTGVAPGRDAVPRGPRELTPAWLSSALGVPVRGVRLVGEDSGTSARARLILDAEGVPRCLFAKLAPQDLPTRLFVALMGLAEREVRFYQELASELPVRVPRCHHAVFSPRSGRFVLLLEDLAAGGAAFRDLTRPCNADEAAAVVVELARLHAALWRSPRFDAELAWLRPPESGGAFRVERFVTERLVGLGVRRHAGLLPAEQRRAAKRLPRLRAALEAEWRRGPTALLHGDPHLGNLWQGGRLESRPPRSGLSDSVQRAWKSAPGPTSLPPLPKASGVRAPAGQDSEGPGLLDWQVARCGDPFRDLVYFLVLSLSVETRRARERELLRLYLETLDKEGVSELGFEEAWRRQRANALYVWIAAVATAGAATLQSAPIVAAGLERAGAALQDLDPEDALPRHP